jgi:hypothetical protein
VGLLGGLLIASADTHGKPSLSWRTRRVTDALADSVHGTVHGAAASVEGAAKSARGSVKEAAKSIESTATTLKKKANAIVS